MSRGGHGDLELLELGGVHNLVDGIDDPGHPLFGVRDFVFLQVPHLAGIGSEVFGQGSIPTELHRQVNASVSEVDKE